MIIALVMLAFCIVSLAVYLVLIRAVSRLCCWLGVHEPADIVQFRRGGCILKSCCRCGRLIP